MEFVLGSLVTLITFFISFFFAWKICPYLPSIPRIFSGPSFEKEKIVIPQVEIEAEEEEIYEEEDEVDIDEILQNWKDAEEEEHTYQLLKRFKEKSRSNNDGWLHY